MSGVRTSSAGYDVQEDTPFARVPDLERAQHIRLALESLDPPRDHKKSHSQSLTPSSAFFSSTSSKKVLRHKRKYPPPALKLDVQHPALQRLESFMDLTVTELGSRHIKSQRSLPTLRTVALPVPTHAYRSSITFNVPSSSPTSTAALSPTATLISDTNLLTVPSAHPPLSPLTPPPLSPSTAKRKRFSRLCRKFGESPPHELVFGGLPVSLSVEPRKARVQDAACLAAITQESKESPLSCNLDTSSTSALGTSSSENLHRPSSILLEDAEKLPHISRQYSTACMLERKGRRITQRNYEDILKRLRML
ncbi:uncharacterized protein F5147DRAFT_773641 [Suillus discolor]|uniref:Uncharacterized protein n=1 Tax=Suillus discolor TaxID=1912936 RepID=A0A9P7F662_9AGAM|nr:uncharacterized protein F5147DRAFT_773641 [Suillus discolor]KAG2108436.1 hypothetical protein F5147DRAFT_773641 [Suillus discolor]